jgi:malyl-CoA/(S)-citramalyl-CoA lyase
MSFAQVAPKFDRLYRSKLFVPGSRPELAGKIFAKAAPDVVCLDLEDSVAPSDKEVARGNIVKLLNEADFRDAFVTVRINGLDTHWCYRDVIALVEEGGERLDAIMIPKCGKGADIYAIDMLITQAGEAVGRNKEIGLEALIETAMGIENIDEICAASDRLQTVHFGAADFAASMGMRTTNIGGSNKDYTVLTDADEGGKREAHWGDLYHYPLMRLVAAARSHGLVPIDGPFGNYSDTDGFRSQAMRSAVMGFEGKWAIHPSQVALCNEIYSPPAAEVEKARGILAAMREAESSGAGAVTYKGGLVDRASVRQAEVIDRKMKQIEGK